MLSRTVSELSQTIVQTLDEKRSLGVLSPLGELRGKLQYTVHLRLIGKFVLVVGFLFVLNESISLSVTAKALYERILIGYRCF